MTKRRHPIWAIFIAVVTAQHRARLASCGALIYESWISLWNRHDGSYIYHFRISLPVQPKAINVVPYRFEWVAEDTVLTEYLSQNRETVMRNE